jgi:hypothetical protein
MVFLAPYGAFLPHFWHVFAMFKGFRGCETARSAIGKAIEVRPIDQHRLIGEITCKIEKTLWRLF